MPYSPDPSVQNGLVTDANYLVAQPTLVPEQALGRFQGEDPNGTWTLRVSDDHTGFTGTLTGWKLDLTTASCAPLAPSTATTAPRAHR